MSRSGAWNVDPVNSKIYEIQKKKGEINSRLSVASNSNGKSIVYLPVAAFYYHFLVLHNRQDRSYYFQQFQFQAHHWWSWNRFHCFVAHFLAILWHRCYHPFEISRTNVVYLASSAGRWTKQCGESIRFQMQWQWHSTYRWIIDDIGLCHFRFGEHLHG